jgi:DNA-binding MarR family transcriptional regulator
MNVSMARVSQFDPAELDTKIGYLFKVVQNGLHDAMDRALQNVGLTIPLYAALTVLDQHPDISKADLARLCFVRPQSMTRVMAALVEAGYVTRSAHPRHGRILQTRLTRGGRRKLLEASGVIDELMGDVLDGFSIAERRQFMDMLSRCRDQLAGERARVHLNGEGATAIGSTPRGTSGADTRRARARVRRRT